MTWQPIPEPEFVPYQSFKLDGVAAILVLAPHPDDEVIGCGGLLSTAAAQGIDVRVVVLSAGDQAGCAQVRERECRDAAAVLGYAQDDPAQLCFWGLQDRGLAPTDGLVQRIRAAAHVHLLAQAPAPAVRACWVLAPSPFEVHPDHRAVTLAAIAAIGAGPSILGFYEVGQPLLANALVDITPVLERKRDALACFGSQLALQCYGEQTMALNRYRAYTLGPAVTHAEAFWFPGEAAAADADAVLDALHRSLARRLGRVLASPELT